MIPWTNVAFFLISCMVPGFFDKFQILWQLYLIELLGLLIGVGQLQLYSTWQKAFDRIRHASLLHKVKSYVISGQMFGLISSFLSNRQLLVVLDEKYSQEYPVNDEVPQGSILGFTLFLLCINDLPDDVFSTIGIYADDTTLYSNLWSGIWSVATARGNSWTWIWSTRYCGLGWEVTC